MTRPHLLPLAALALAALLPFAASAQQAPSAPIPHRHAHGMMHAFRGITLTDAQRTQIRNDITQFRQAHPKGSAPDPQARKALRAQIMSVLTPDQQAQLKANIERERAAHRSRAFPSAPAPTSSPV